MTIKFIDRVDRVEANLICFLAVNGWMDKASIFDDFDLYQAVDDTGCGEIELENALESLGKKKLIEVYSSNFFRLKEDAVKSVFLSGYESVLEFFGINCQD